MRSLGGQRTFGPRFDGPGSALRALGAAISLPRRIRASLLISYPFDLPEQLLRNLQRRDARARWRLHAAWPYSGDFNAHDRNRRG
jgi:hypothetical protein